MTATPTPPPPGDPPGSPPPGPGDARLFPALSAEQYGNLRQYGERRRVPRGTVLAELGSRDAPFFVLRSGRFACWEHRADGDRLVAELLPGNFGGDIALFTGRPTTVVCVAAEDSEMLVVEGVRLRRATADRPDLAELLVGTLVHRRRWLEEHGFGLARVLGHRHSHDAFLIRSLLARNPVPHRWVDLTDPGEEAALLTAAATPNPGTADPAADPAAAVTGADGGPTRPRTGGAARSTGSGADSSPEGATDATDGPRGTGSTHATPGPVGTPPGATGPGGGAPVVVDGRAVLRGPSLPEVARHFGLLAELGAEPYDLAVVGGGPAGPAAAVHGASEGLRTVVLDRFAPGGRAGTSSRIENHLGFPSGLSGADPAGRALLQAQRFGAVCSSCQEVGRVAVDDPAAGTFRLALDDGGQLLARSVVPATGAEYRRPAALGIDRYEGTGVSYSAGHSEAVGCREEEVVVVGGGNSAGQAAVHLSGRASRVHLVVRGPDLAASISTYPLDRVRAQPGAIVHTGTVVRACHGECGLRAGTLADADGRERRLDTRAVLVMCGAAPRSEPVAGPAALDRHGFVLTGAEAGRWLADRGRPPGRTPHPLETTVPGLLAAGDVRSGSTKRVATAVGDGALAVRHAHEWITAHRPAHAADTPADRPHR